MQNTLFLLLFMLLGAPSAYVTAQEHADCITAMQICEKKIYHIDHLSGEGRDKSEADLIACFMGSENDGQAEENSIWIRFEIAKSGNLTFTITPDRYDDDLDFIVYRLTDGTCNNKKIVRCNAAGDPGIAAGTSPCLGETGLREGETDSSVDAGCNDTGDNAWLAPLQVSKGEIYVILVSNVSSRGPGFTIRFAGTAFMPCDQQKPQSTAVKKKPAPKPAAPPVAKKTTRPESIGGRTVEVGEELKVKNRKIKLKLWDSQVEDGDIISVFVNEAKVVDHLRLRLKPQEFDIELPPGKEHYITIFADDFGKAEPNSAMISINDGVKIQVIDLVAGRKKQESVRIILE